MPSPYDTPLIQAFLNSILLQVRVPVLSEKMKSTCPSSSFRSELRTIVDRRIDSSVWMSCDWNTFTIPIVTVSEIGMKLENRMTYEKNLRIDFPATSEVVNPVNPKYSLIWNVLLLAMRPHTRAPIIHRISWIKKAMSVN